MADRHFYPEFLGHFVNGLCGKDAFDDLLDLFLGLLDGFARRQREPHAAVSRQDLLTVRLRRMAEQVCDGTASPLVNALVEGGQLSAADLSELRKLLHNMERKQNQKP